MIHRLRPRAVIVVSEVSAALGFEICAPALLGSRRSRTKRKQLISAQILHIFHRRQQAELRIGVCISYCLLIVAYSFGMIAPARSATAGFEQIQFPLPGGGSAEGAIWFPSSSPAALMTVGLSEQQVARSGAILGDKLPLIVFSHGALGSWKNNIDTAAALARAGFVTAALTYDKPALDGVLRVAQHGQRLSALIDFVLYRWHYHEVIDPKKIGAFGFSLGAFTVLTEVGGKPDLARIPLHCQTAPSEWSCRMAAGRHLDIAVDGPVKVDWAVDSRIKAAAIAAPALGYLFEGGGLSAAQLPVQLWQAGDDHVLSEPWSAEAVRDSLPHRPEFHLVPGADHEDFNVPCANAAKLSAPSVCGETKNFSRVAFHVTFNEKVLQFFRNAFAGRG